jgi:hypothetical protein
MIPDIRNYLQSYLLPSSVGEAREFVELARSAYTYLDLYHYYFPAAFARSLERNRRHWLIPVPQQAYTVFEVQFLKLVQAQLFPLPEYVLEDVLEGESRCFQIPIEPNGLPTLFDDYWAGGEALCDLDLGWQLMLFLGGQLEADFFNGVLMEPDEGIFDLHVNEGQLDRNALRINCDECEGPLAYLYLAVAVLERDTGTVWLDAMIDQPIDNAQWCRDTVDNLVEQFLQSEDIWDKAMRFVNWLEEDVLQHFTEVINLWNKSLRTEQQPPQEQEQLLQQEIPAH